MATANTRVVNGINTRVLHNKDYVEVAERVRIVHELKKEFEQVETTHFDISNRWFVRCVIKVDGKMHIGTAEIKFDAPKNSPDGTNPFECAETSALGRALAFAGLGTVESIASYDEIARSKPFVAVIEQPQGRVVESAEVKQIESAKPVPPLNKAIIEARKVGFITGKDKAELSASLDEQIIQLFGSRISDVDLAKPANLARLNGAIEAFSRQQAK